MNGDLTDQIRFQLPMCIAPRYGHTPASMIGAFEPRDDTRLKFTLYVQTTGVIRSVTSPTHPTFSALPYQPAGAGPSPYHMVAHYESPEFLHQDLVVTIQAQGLDEPRCVAERDRKHGSVGMQLMIVPKFAFPIVPSQEYIFLIDRSGSMGGPNIVMAKRTLALLLRTLPAKGSTFNIFSFGSESSSLFPESVEYNQDTLDVAVSCLRTHSILIIDMLSDSTRGWDGLRFWWNRDSWSIGKCDSFTKQRPPDCSLRSDRWQRM